jgi:hypothetical protein
MSLSMATSIRASYHNSSDAPLRLGEATGAPGGQATSLMRGGVDVRIDGLNTVADISELVERKRR